MTNTNELLDITCEPCGFLDSSGMELCDKCVRCFGCCCCCEHCEEMICECEDEPDSDSNYDNVKFRP